MVRREVSSEELLLSWEESLEEPLPVPEELLSWEEEESSSLEELSSGGVAGSEGSSLEELSSWEEEDSSSGSSGYSSLGGSCSSRSTYLVNTVAASQRMVLSVGLK